MNNVMAVNDHPHIALIVFLLIYSSRRLIPVYLHVLINSMIIIRFLSVRVPNIYIYIYIINRIECPVHCKHCKRIEHIPPRSPSDPSPDNFHCLFCLPNYFLNSESICVSGGECGAGTYPDIKAKFVSHAIQLVMVV